MKQDRDPRIFELIPQRDPFLFLDQILQVSETQIEAFYHVRGDEGFLKGHFPQKPIVPGVILQEICFQSGAALMGFRGQEKNNQIGVVSRVQDVKFKQLVVPGDKLTVKTYLDDIVSNAFFMNSKIYRDNKAIMMVKFTGSLVEA